jgi:quercetin dioxygenase-like cupin family protein
LKRAKLDALPPTHVRAGVVRKAFSGSGATLAWTTLERGHAPHPHDHRFEQIVYIVAGEARFMIDDEAVAVSAGDVLVVPPSARHWLEVTSEEPVVELSVFTPRRDEYA